MDLGTRNCSRLISAAISFSMAVILSACGGGGGGSTTPLPAINPTGTLSVAPATCTVPAGLGKCTATATFATANATSAKLSNAGGTVLSTSLSGTQVVDVLIGTNTYTLSTNGGGAVATASVTGVCTVGTVSSGSLCVPPVTATLTASSPVLNGAKSTLTWGHSGDVPTGCTTSSNWSNGGSLSGTGLSDALTTNATFTYSCTNVSGTTTATAVVTVCAVGYTISGGVCTAPVVVTCTAPAMLNSLNACISPPAATGYKWNDVIKAWVVDIGVLVNGLNELPLECKVIGDACWKAKTADGTIKYFETNLVMTGYSTRKIVFAGIVVSMQSGFAAGNFNLIPIYSNTESSAPVLNNLVLNGSITDGVVTLKGSQNGVKFITPTNVCGEQIWLGTGFGSVIITCPI